LNTGLPGTGLYNRTKISSFKKDTISNNAVSVTNSQVSVSLDLNENYEPEIEIYDINGSIMTSPALINALKRKPEYKDNLKKIYERSYNIITDKTAEFTEIYKLILRPVSKQDGKGQ